MIHNVDPKARSSTPACPGVSEDLEDAEGNWADQWHAGLDEALAQHEAGEGTVYMSSEDFLRALDPERAAADGV